MGQEDGRRGGWRPSHHGSADVSARPRATLPPAGRRLAVLAVLAVVAGLVTAATAPAGAAVPSAERREPPVVVGRSLTEARTLLQEQWYPNAEGDYRIDVVPSPTVPEQVPEDAAQVIDQKVTQYLEDSDPKDRVASITLVVGSVVADLVGRTREEAEGILEALGLVAAVKGEGVVIRQSPAPETVVPFGSRVGLVLAPPPSRAGTVVPELRGNTEAQARAAVEGVGLTLRVGATSGEGELRVTEQDPPAGTRVEPGEAVTVTLLGAEVPPALVEVPDVTGLEPQVVRRILAVATLTLAVDPSGTRDGGLSFRQDPEAGTSVTPGSVVTVAFADVDAAPVAWWAWPTGGVAVLAVAGLALWTSRLARRARPRRPTLDEAEPDLPDVRVDPVADPAPLVSVHSPGPRLDLSVRVVPRVDLGALTLEEGPR
ncbi:PASTA domain-containing protein [Oryzobacter telluris]|uniref:PASTA domain-containing protein n=1 Tax=Oryzobacter telluris TaxID=3149179 RepID=UPI00370D3254